jgi:hypothetical protein
MYIASRSLDGFIPDRPRASYCALHPRHHHRQSRKQVRSVCDRHPLHCLHPKQCSQPWSFAPASRLLRGVVARRIRKRVLGLGHRDTWTSRRVVDILMRSRSAGVGAKRVDGRGRGRARNRGGLPGCQSWCWRGTVRGLARISPHWKVFHWFVSHSGGQATHGQ